MSNDKLGHDGKAWPATMDAKVWADEFCVHNNASDHAMMLAWFANAIMIGYDTARWGFEKNPLIAAAPDLLEAVEDALNLPSHSKTYEEIEENWNAWETKARAAITKAKGETK